MGLGGVCAWVFGVVRTSAQRGVEQSTRPSQTTTMLAGRCNAAEDRARARGELAYGDEHGEQRAREVGGKLTGGVAVKWARRRDGAGVGDGDRRRDPKKGTTRGSSCGGRLLQLVGADEAAECCGASWHSGTARGRRWLRLAGVHGGGGALERRSRGRRRGK
jgi:hypothetical protein